MGKHNIIQPVKGTRDFYPEQMAIRTWLYNAVRKVSESFGYQEYEGPYLEYIDLYAAKSGEELVKEQSFVFPDRGGKLIALRPELTPTLARMVAQRQGQLTFPIRWWSYGPFWRYERPQKGRTREFFQWNLDLIGLASPITDAEIVSVITSFFRLIGLSSQEIIINVNNRRLMDVQLGKIGIKKNKKEVFRLIDRKEKLKQDAWLEYGIELGLTTDQINSLTNLLENKELWHQSEELEQFFDLIDVMGISDYVHYDPKIIRGLDYYTGTVYEAKSKDPSIKRAILGGGRYDNLLADVGGNPLPGAGFAMGDVVITLLLNQLQKLTKDLRVNPAPVFVTVFDDKHMAQSFRIADDLRKSGLNVNIYPQAIKLGKQIKYANRIGAKIVLIIGPDEIKDNTVTIKILNTGEQQTIGYKSVINYLIKMLEPDKSS
ncbi:MAG TPA: histidine--tRNA ligase [Anaerolineae bacterium]|nr:histidine--tRNA ligase [Anaerolineae bacterium]